MEFINIVYLHSSNEGFSEYPEDLLLDMFRQSEI